MVTQRIKRKRKKSYYNENSTSSMMSTSETKQRDSLRDSTLRRASEGGRQRLYFPRPLSFSSLVHGLLER